MTEPTDERTSKKSLQVPTLLNINTLLDDAYRLGKTDATLNVDDYTELMPKIKARADLITKNLLLEAQKTELLRAKVGRVVSVRNKTNKTYMSGFNYAANNLQTHKIARLAELGRKVA